MADVDHVYINHLHHIRLQDVMFTFSSNKKIEQMSSMIIQHFIAPHTCNITWFICTIQGILANLSTTDSTVSPVGEMLRPDYPGIESDDNRWAWWVCDYTADLLFLLDLLLVKPRIRFIHNGLFVVRISCYAHYLKHCCLGKNYCQS